MPDKVEVIGGRSGPRKISIMSPQFIGFAEAKNDGSIETSVKPVPRVVRWARDKRRWYLPQTVKLLIFIFGILNWRNFLPLFLGLMFGFSMFRVLGFSSPSVAQIEQMNFFSTLVLPISAILFIAVFIAPWHGAEHKAIEAYLNKGRTSLAAIKTESRVSKRCGSRLMIPILLTSIAPYYCFTNHYTVSMLCFLEATFWIDKLWGWNNIPIISHLSLMIQRFLLTREPGELELQTAKAALASLLEAHEQAQNQ